MPFIIRNGSNTTAFTLQDMYLDLIIAADEHVDLEQVFPEDSLYMSSVSPNALYAAIQNGDIVRRNDADDTDIAIANAFDDAIWRWSPSRQQKEALVGQPLSPSSTNKYLTQGVFSLKAKVTGTARYGDLVLLEGSNITLTDDGSGNFTIAASGTIPFYSPVTLTPDSGNIEGTSTSAARADHKHDLPAATAVSISTSNAEGTSTSVARADHLHQGIHSLKAKVTGTVRYGDIVFLEGSNITITDDGAGNFTIAASSITYGSPVTLTPDSGNIEGTSTSVARIDHKHDLPAATAVSISTSNAEGTSTSVARADHLHQGVHGLKANAGGTVRYGDVILAQGTNVTITDDGLGTFTITAASLSYASPVTLVPDGGNVEGTNTTVARSDHKHDLPADTAVSVTTSNAEGTSTSVARADHLHQGIHSLKATAGGTARYGDIVFLAGTNVSISDDGAGNFTIGSSESYAAPVTLVPDGGNVEGTNTTVARSDHKHDLPAATAVSISTSNAEGTSTSVARADHLHQGIHSLKATAGGTARYGDLVFLAGTNISISDDGAGNFTIGSSESYGPPVALTPDSGNIEGTSTSVARIDHKHDLPASAPTTTLSPATTNAEGTTTSVARADHTHAIATALTAVITTIQPDATADQGTQDSYARGDHRHAIVADAPTTSLSATTANAEGTSTSISRADHTHDILTAAPITQIPDQANAEGTSTSIARADHVHNIVADPAVSISTSNAEGTSTSIARADHLHQGVHSLKANAGGTARYGDLVFLGGSNITLTDDGVGNFTIAAASISYATPSTLVPDGGNVEGTNTTVARSDHKHDIPAATAISISTSNAEGTSTSIARADHLHQGVHSLKANAGGTARYGDLVFLAGTNVSISDDGAGNFTFGFGASGSYATPVTLVPDGGNVEGTNTSVARSDHRHDLPAATAVSVGSTNAEGTSTSVARADHVHSITNRVKAGVVASGSFSGSPKKATVTFTAAFGSTNYAIEIKGVDVRTWSYDSATKATTGFVINSNANAALTGEVSWTATEVGS